jgi:DNA-binding MarR family transcriptional regulator
VLYSTLHAIYYFERDLYEEYGLGYQEICLLQLLLREPGIRVGEAASNLEIPLFTATRLAQRLESRGFIRKRVDELDGRAVCLSLTPKGSKLIRAIEKRSYDIMAANAARLSASEVEAYLDVAENLGELLGVAGRTGAHRP